LQRLSVIRNKGIQVHEPDHPFWCAIGDARDDHPTIAVPNQDNIGQLFIDQDVEDVLNVGRKVDFRRCQVTAFP